jgi:hypothetical protein
MSKMLRFALDGITSFSLTPLTLATYAGFVTSGIAVLGIAYALVLRLFTSYYVTGWTALFIAVLFIGGIQLTALGIMGQYVGRIYREAKRRPLYVVQERLGFDRTAAAEVAGAEVARAATAHPAVERRERRVPAGDRRSAGDRRGQDRRAARPHYVARRA